MANKRQLNGQKPASVMTAYLLVGLGSLIMLAPFYFMFVFATHSKSEIFTLPPPMWPGTSFFENLNLNQNQAQKEPFKNLPDSLKRLELHPIIFFKYPESSHQSILCYSIEVMKITWPSNIHSTSVQSFNFQFLT